MKTKLVIFDLDGTLLYTLSDLTASVNFALKKFGCPLKTQAEVQSYVGNGVEKLVERAIKGGKNNENFEKILNTFKMHYVFENLKETKPYNGILLLLKELKAKEIQMAVLSNKPDKVTKQLCEKYFQGFFDIVLGANENIDKKPSADGVLFILKTLKFDSFQAVFVGDSEVDILTAKNAQIPCVSAIWGYKTKEFLIEHSAKTLIDNPLELLRVLDL